MRKIFFLLAAIVLGALGFSANAKRVYFVNTADWANICVHHWTDGGTGSTWPGDQLNKNTNYVTIDGITYYYFDTDHAKIIFNNSNGGSVSAQTSDLPATDGAVYCYSKNPQGGSTTNIGTIQNGKFTPNIGDVNNWYIQLTGSNGQMITGTSEIQPGTNGIAVWENVALGTTSIQIKAWDGNTKTDTWFNKANSALALDTWTTVSNAGGSTISISGSKAGDKYNVYLNCATNQAMVSKYTGSTEPPQPVLPELYVRGSYFGTDWPANAQTKMTLNDTPNSSNEYEYTLHLDEFYGDFKIADSGWGKAFGQGSGTLSIGNKFAVGGGDNLSLGDNEYTDVTITFYYNPTGTCYLKIDGTLVEKEIDYTTWSMRIMDEAGGWIVESPVYGDEEGFITIEDVALGTKKFQAVVNNSRMEAFYNKTSDGKALTVSQWADVVNQNGSTLSIDGASTGDVYNIVYDCKNQKLKVEKIASTINDPVEVLYLSYNGTGENWWNPIKPIELQRKDAGEGVYTYTYVFPNGFRPNVKLSKVSSPEGDYPDDDEDAKWEVFDSEVLGIHERNEDKGAPYHIEVEREYQLINSKAGNMQPDFPGNYTMIVTYKPDDQGVYHYYIMFAYTEDNNELGIYVRGDINDWYGDAMELKRTEDGRPFMTDNGEYVLVKKYDTFYGNFKISDHNEDPEVWDNSFNFGSSNGDDILLTYATLELTEQGEAQNINMGEETLYNVTITFYYNPDEAKPSYVKVEATPEYVNLRGEYNGWNESDEAPTTVVLTPLSPLEAGKTSYVYHTKQSLSGRSFKIGYHGWNFNYGVGSNDYGDAPINTTYPAVANYGNFTTEEATQNYGELDVLFYYNPEGESYLLFADMPEEVKVVYYRPKQEPKDNVSPLAIDGEAEVSPEVSQTLELQDGPDENGNFTYVGQNTKSLYGHFRIEDANKAIADHSAAGDETFTKGDVHDVVRGSTTMFNVPDPTVLEGGVMTFVVNPNKYIPEGTFHLSDDATVGVSDIAVDGADANGESIYYNLQGVRVANPVNGAIYIRVQGGQATKVVK